MTTTTTMTIKNLPKALYKRLRESAEAHRRSINHEAIVCLERALHSKRADPDGFLASVHELRARLPKINVTEEELRTMKNEGRA